MAGLPDGFTMLPEGHEPIVSGVTIASGNTINIMPSTSVTDPPYPRLKARPPQQPQSVQRQPTDTSGQPGSSTTTPIETDAGQQDDNMDAAAQSISSASSSVASTIDGQTIVAMEGLMWESLVSPQCAPLVVMQQLQESELAENYNNSTT
eukprot:4898882-Amphidinium_carterae.1